jgi:hypothetical protein
MRKSLVLVALFALSTVAHAKPAHEKARRNDPRLAYVEDEPMAPAASSMNRTKTPETGTRMDGTIRAPEVSRVSSGDAVARGTSGAIPERSGNEIASGDALDELVARQMRKNQASIDACVKAEIRRKPTANGTVTLAVVVTDKKIQSVHVAGDTVHDIDLDSCLVKAGLGWKLQLAQAEFEWPVTLSPSASR